MIGLYFFEGENKTVTVISTRYIVMFENYLQHSLKEIGEKNDLGNVWFQQDDATAYTTKISLAVLQRMFPGFL